MGRYSPSVERWRALIGRYFAPGDVDKALYVVEGESCATAPAGPDVPLSIGLFQLNDRGLGPWGEGVTYKRKLSLKRMISLMSRAIRKRCNRWERRRPR